MINAPITPGTHPRQVRRKTISTDPHPRSITASGGKIIPPARRRARSLGKKIAAVGFIGVWPRTIGKKISSAGRAEACSGKKNPVPGQLALLPNVQAPMFSFRAKGPRVQMARLSFRRERGHVPLARLSFRSEGQMFRRPDFLSRAESQRPASEIIFPLPSRPRRYSSAALRAWVSSISASMSMRV